MGRTNRKEKNNQNVKVRVHRDLGDQIRQCYPQKQSRVAVFCDPGGQGPSPNLSFPVGSYQTASKQVLKVECLKIEAVA